MSATAEIPVDGGKRKFPRATAVEVAREMVMALAPFCANRIVVAGSLRRRKAEVGDVEIVYVPQMRPGVSTDMFAAPAEVPRTDDALLGLLALGVIEKRATKTGATPWGPQNKFAVHVASGVPVDFFATTEEKWWGYLVCRTGGFVNNVKICNAAIANGWKWNSYDGQFSRASGLGREVHPIGSEREVFEFVGLEYLEPWERE